jgi:hypothetical protein
MLLKADGPLKQKTLLQVRNHLLCHLSKDKERIITSTEAKIT